MIGSYLHGHVNAVSLRRVERVDHNAGSMPDSVHEPPGVESGNVRASACRDDHVAPPIGVEFALDIALPFRLEHTHGGRRGHPRRKGLLPGLTTIPVGHNGWSWNIVNYHQ